MYIPQLRKARRPKCDIIIVLLFTFCTRVPVVNGADAKPGDRNEPKVTMVLRNDQGAEGQTVALLSEADASDGKRELYYYYLFIPRFPDSTTVFEKQVESQASYTDSLPIGSGQGNQKVVNVFRTPDHDFIAIHCYGKTVYTGAVPLLGSDVTLVNFEELQRKAPETLMSADISGALSSKTLTVCLEGGG